MEAQESGALRPRLLCGPILQLYHKFLNFTVTIGRPSARASALSVGRGA